MHSTGEQIEEAPTATITSKSEPFMRKSSNRILAVPDALDKPSEGCYHSRTLCSPLLESPNLRGWERLFVKTLAKSPRPGRKQLEKLEAIAARLGYIERSKS